VRGIGLVNGEFEAPVRPRRNRQHGRRERRPATGPVRHSGRQPYRHLGHPGLRRLGIRRGRGTRRG
jgi:hypothetical protein